MLNFQHINNNRQFINFMFHLILLFKFDQNHGY